MGLERIDGGRRAFKPEEMVWAFMERGRKEYRGSRIAHLFVQVAWNVGV